MKLIIDICKGAYNSVVDGHLDACLEYFTDAIKNGTPLEQEPCEDAISREAVREILTKYRLGESRIAEELNELSSVQRTSNADKKHVENTLEDAISRQAVLDLWHLRLNDKEIYKAIYDMPPVNPIDVLDKIRAEIDSHCSENRDRNDGLYIAMKIIDKYRKGEQE